MNRFQLKPVPQLNLAPKLRRPLSLWNPLDYLRVLYWVFFFPQALRWYIETFGGESVPNEMNWREGLALLRRNPVHRHLLLHGICLIILVPVLAGIAGQGLGFSVDWFGVTFGVAAGVAAGVAFGVAAGVVRGVAFGVAAGVAGGVAGGVAAGRLETWLLYFLLAGLKPFSRNMLIPAVTPLPLPQVLKQLKTWLQQDWEMGLQNANQVLAYSVQFGSVVLAVNQVLSKMPSEQIIFRVAQLAESPYDWQLVRFATVPLADALWSTAIDGIFLLPSAIKRRLKARLRLNPRLDTPAHAAAAGFWFLHKEEPNKAIKGFAAVRALPYGQELWMLATILARFDQAKDPSTIAQIELPLIPTEPYLRPHS